MKPSNMSISVNEYYPGRYSLFVNNVKIGEYIYGDKKYYLDPEAWAKKQLPKRLKVLERNMLRLKAELLDLETEYSKLMGYDR